MLHFHEHKLWQESFVALMDVHDLSDKIMDENEELAENIVEAAQNVTSKIADGLSRNDPKIGRNLIYDSVGLVAVTRTQLAVAWGRGLVDDETFKKLDDKYANLTNHLQIFR